MDAAYISTLSALAGSIIGGFTAGLTTWMNQHSQAKAAQTAHQLFRREDLYRDFIVAASKAYGEATMTNEPQIPILVGIYGMISRMRVLSAPQTVACAESVMRVIMDTYSAPNSTLADVHSAIRNGVGVDPLKKFAEAARQEVGTASYL